MSQKSGVIFCHWSAWAVAIKVKEGIMTSPLRPAARMVISRATVALHIAMQCLTPRKSARFLSSCWTYGPSLVSHLLSNRSLIRAKSRSRLPMLGLPTCNFSAKAGRSPKMANSSTSCFITGPGIDQPSANGFRRSSNLSCPRVTSSPL